MSGGVSFAFDSGADAQIWADTLRTRKVAPDGMPEEHEVVIRCKNEAEALECEKFLKRLFHDMAQATRNAQ